MRKMINRLKFILQFWKFIPFLKDFFKSNEVQLHYKALATLLVLTYLAIPVDLIRDYTSLLGYVDDLVISIIVFERMLKLAPRSLKKNYQLS